MTSLRRWSEQLTPPFQYFQIFHSAENLNYKIFQIGLNYSEIKEKKVFYAISFSTKRLNFNYFYILKRDTTTILFDCYMIPLC